MPLRSTVLRVLTTVLLLSPAVLLSLTPDALLPVQAQTVQDRKAEADRLLQAGIQAYQAGKTTEALEIFQKLLLISR
jgi:hypothetical protein